MPFIVIANQKHAPALRCRVELLLQGNWNQHFEMIENDRNPRPTGLEEGVKASQTFNRDHG